MDNYNGEKEMPDRYSLRGKVFHRLREDILSGKYAQNDELREAAISKSMGAGAGGSCDHYSQQGSLCGWNHGQGYF